MVPATFFSRVERYIPLLIILLAFIFYGNTLKNGYSLDDELNTHINPQVAGGIKAIPDILTSMYYQEEGNIGKLSFGYRPLTKITFAIEASLFGNNPKRLLKVSHFMNVLLYALTILILLSVLKKLFKAWHPAFPLMISLLFLAHPLHTEVVASLKNREEILSLMGGLGALYFLLRYTETNHWKYLVFSVLTFIAGYLSKSSILTFLIIYPLSLYFFTDIKHRKLLIVTAIFLVVLLASQILPRLWLPDQIRPTELVENPLFMDHSLSHRIGTGMVVLLHYLVQMILNPADMAFYYGFDMFPVVGITNVTAIMSLLIHIGLFCVAVWQWNKQKVISYAILFYLVTISMYSNIIVPVVGIAAERFLFIPSIGFCIALALGIMRISRTRKENWMRFKPDSLYASTLMILIMVIYAGITINRNADWQDLPTLYKADIPKLERSVKANTQYAGNILYTIFNGQPPKEPTREDVRTMLLHFNRALKVQPDYYDALNSKGSIYSTLLGEQDEAIRLFLLATKSKPKITAAWINLGYSYIEKGNYNKAIEAYERVLELDPKRMKAIFKLAEVYQKKGEISEAIALNERAMQMDTASELPYINIGNYFLLAHDTAMAVTWWQKAVEKQPLEQLSRNLSLHFQRIGNQEKAEYYRRKADEAKGVVIIHK